jgi:hypothetical protein
MKKQSINNGELLREFPPFQINDNLTGGYRLPCTNHSRARNNFYVVLNGFMPAYVCDLSVDEVREHYPDVTLGDFFHEGIQEWIMRLYQVGVNPLPYLREVYTEYNFKFVEKGVATPDVPLPAPGATILVFRDGGMAVMENALNQKEE